MSHLLGATLAHCYKSVRKPYFFTFWLNVEALRTLRTFVTCNANWKCHSMNHEWVLNTTKTSKTKFPVKAFQWKRSTGFLTLSEWVICIGNLESAGIESLRSPSKSSCSSPSLLLAELSLSATANAWPATTLIQFLTIFELIGPWRQPDVDGRLSSDTMGCPWSTASSAFIELVLGKIGSTFYGDIFHLIHGLWDKMSLFWRFIFLFSSHYYLKQIQGSHQSAY